MKKRSKPIFSGAEILASLIYLCALSAGLMYVLCRDHVVICTVIMTAAAFGVYMIFYVLRKKKALSVPVFIVLFMIVYAVCRIVGNPSRSPSFFDFIFNASEFFDPVLAGMAILLFALIIGFPACYFTVYLPRPAFLLLTAFVPLILAARLVGRIPPGLLVFIAVGYLLAVLGIARPEFPVDNAYVDDKRARIERAAVMGTAGIAAAALLIVIPRNDYTPMIRYLEDITRRTSAYGQRVMNEFTESSSVNRGNNTLSDDALFIAYTNFPKNVSRQSFDIYNGDDGWTFDKAYSRGYNNWENHRSRLNINKLIFDLKNGAADGKLEKYGEALNRMDDIPKVYSYAAAQMTIRISDGSSTTVIMHPSETIDVNVASPDNSSTPTYRNINDEIFTERPMQRNASYVVSYYYNQPNEQFIKMLENVDFEELLNAAAEEGVIEKSVRDEYISEIDNAEAYYEAELDGDIPDEIRAVAEEITAGLSNDYEKAVAIEKWFGEAGFTYDLNFVPDRAGADYFMFESRRGICSDFATASTLLLRAAGIPARYTEGFVLSEEALDPYGRYVVTGKYAHAYSTAYIEGYGWLEVDGTKHVPIGSLSEEITRRLTLIILLCAAVIAAVIVFHRQIAETFFGLFYRLRSKNGKIRTVYLKTRRLACAIAQTDPKSTTAEEVCDIISRTLSLEKEAKEITDAANELFYGSGTPDADVKKLYRDYRTICRIKRSRKK